MMTTTKIEGGGDDWETTTATGSRRGGEHSSVGILSMCEEGRGGWRGRGNKEYDNNRDKVNGYDVNGDVLQWRVVKRNYAALALAD